MKSSEKGGEGRRRAIYDGGTNVESGEKREILNGQERMSNGVRDTRDGKRKGGREGGRRSIEVGKVRKAGERESRRRLSSGKGRARDTSSVLFHSASAGTSPICIVDDFAEDNIKKCPEEKLSASKGTDVPCSE